ncbi:hypothetical protein BGW80DRAFT_1454936 [Lactifluus volemus]|nr:hypothetical protein BGW80DRAFT_1454936 [Lactifluus volemus]
MFDLYRLAESDQYEENILNVTWRRQRWWFKLVHVCRQWRNIILESPSRLDLHLLCTVGVPVADMLAHSPLLPLTIYYRTDLEITAEDESGIFLALSHRDRVHYVDLWTPNVEKFISVMDDQFPILERILIDSGTKVALPVTIQAPNLRHLKLRTAYLPIGSPLITTTAAGLVTLELLNIPPWAYFPPSYILTRLSLMAKLERLSITFHPRIRNRDVERQSRQTPDVTTLPNLRRFLFRGRATYLEGLVTWISAPSLSILCVKLFNPLPLTVPRLCQFIQSSESLTFRTIQVTFREPFVSLHAVPWKWDTSLMLQIKCGHIDWQVASVVQFFGTLSPVLSSVEKVAFSYDEGYQQLEWLNNVDRSQWRGLLRPFTNAKTIHIKDSLISRIFHSLPSDEGEPPLELLPNLEEIGHSGGGNGPDTFTRFLDERQVSGHPVSLRLVDPSMFDKPQYLY